MAYTKTCSPNNSTPFSSCCNIASFGEKCEKCGEKITHHDDGLGARRREVGPGKCLMCGKPRGNPAVIGNCCC